MTDPRSFLDIPYEERIVPFPNMASVLMQHAREFPDKAALCFPDSRFTYAGLLNACLTGKPEHEPEKIIVSLRDTENSCLLILFCLFHGIPFHLDHSEETNTRLTFDPDKNIQHCELPYVHADRTALLLMNSYSFSQYNLMVAAQAVGKALKLFRPGHAVCALPLSSVSDLVLGVLAPFYYAKTIRFDCNDPANEVFSGTAQYAWCKDIVPEILPADTTARLRDASLVFSCVPPDVPGLPVYRLLTAFDHAAGLGPLMDKDGNILSLPGMEIIRDGNTWNIRGHVLGQRIDP